MRFNMQGILMNITYEVVTEVADSLHEKGQYPSIENVCASLGLIGFEREVIANFLERWYQERPDFSALNFINKTARLTDQIILKNSKLKSTLAMVRAILESTEDAVLIIDNSGNVLDWNKKFSSIWRTSVVGIKDLSDKIGLLHFVSNQILNPKDLREELNRLRGDCQAKGKSITLFFKDGRVFLCTSKFQVLEDGIECRVWKFKDYTQLYFAEETLRIKASAIEASFHGIYIIDLNKADKPIIFVNPAFCRITGFDEKEIVGRSYTALLGEIPNELDLKHLTTVIEGRLDKELIIQCQRKNGEDFWCELHLSPTHDEQGRIWHYVGILSDITQQRDIAEAMQQQATHDSLTKLPNRFLLSDRAQLAIKRAKRQDLKVALLFLDLDNFKVINDSLGHKIGDRLLCQVASRLQQLLRQSDTLARVGGDEYIILLPDLDNRLEPNVIAKRIVASFAKPFQVDDHTLCISCSIGICIYPEGANDLEGLLKGADLSLYSAKDKGKNTFEYFIKEMSAKAQRRMAIESEMRYALANNEFHLVFQPIYDLKNKEIVGRESLLRWQNKKLGKVNPEEFIPIAEETGLLLDIGAWAIEQACIMQNAFINKEKKECYLSVNLSVIQLKQHNIADKLRYILKTTNFKASLLEIELTESLLFNSSSEMLSQLDDLRAMGIQLAIDDFGTGFSNISYLQKFTVNKLKIDKSFIFSLGSQSQNETIVKAIINLAHSLGITIVAEGIENVEQYQFLLDIDCDYGQGFYLGKPA